MINHQTLASLTGILGSRLVTSASDLALHGRSESHFPPMPPDAIAYVHSTQEVQDILCLCNQTKTPVIGWGTGTSLEGHTAAPQGGLCVDFSQMDQIITISPEDMLVTVQPGITREALNMALRDTGLFFPVDPGANASLGGMCATRASGTTAVRYGTMKDNVAALQVVLADGTIITTGSKAKKSSAGYDLTSLMIGSEGTLGLITELTLRLHPIPEATSAGIVAFDTLHQAVDAVTQTIQMALPMARLEFLDAASVAAFNAYAGTDMPVMPHLLFELHGSTQSVAEQAELFGDICAELNGHDFKWSSKTEERTALWTLRHNGYYAILASRNGARAIVTDICVPISKLAKAVDDTVKDIDASGITGPILGHVGDGNFHAILLIDDTNPQEIDLAQQLSDRMVQRALDLGGTCTGEHGIGLGKRKFMEREHGPAWDIMTTIKSALDPNNILNPGKVIK